MLRISKEKVCYVIERARNMIADPRRDDSDESYVGDHDGLTEELESDIVDPVYQELHDFLEAQSDEEIEDLVALMWVGRGDYGTDAWSDALAEVRDVRHHHTVDYLLSTPLLPDYLDEGLAGFGLSCSDEA